MLFKDRADAAEKLALLLKNDSYLRRKTTQKKGVIVSLLRGGIVIGDVLANSLGCKHLPLAVKKIPAPGNPELAIGALCFDTIYLEKRVIDSLGLDKLTLSNQISLARKEFNSYSKKFAIKKTLYQKIKKNSVVVLTDDGIATGASIRCASLFIKQFRPRQIFLAVPVAPSDFSLFGFTKVFILHKDKLFTSVSKFYADFPQVQDEEVGEILS